ncbi:putative 2OG-Fe(II) oxygenase [Gammaproteobacteria bacterium]|nr:putative 2OG-Fe(II) oxygenase [Gammaproteobacteria bacterium]
MNAKTLTNKAIKLFEDGKFDAVIEIVGAVTVDSITPDLINLKALSYKNKADFNTAIKIYKDALEFEKHPVYFGNLGNIYKATGRVRDAIVLYKEAIAGNPDEYNFHESLGLSFMDTGELMDARSCFEKCQELQPDRESGRYLLGTIYRKQSQWEKAVSYLKNCSTNKAKSHMLECLYYLNDRQTFEAALAEVPQEELVTPLAGCVAAHASWRFGTQFRNYFCKAPMNAVGVSEVSESEGLTDKLIGEIISLYDDGVLDDLHQPLLSEGKQSAGNIFLLDVPAISDLKNIIEKKIDSYREKLRARNEGFIDQWPEKFHLYGWLVSMTSGGSLNSHIHKEGWVSGSLYLQAPENSRGKEAAISFCLDGADYPTDNMNFPEKYVKVEKRKICMFPSSLFHKTTKFNSGGRRITLAFDVIPLG